MERETYDHTDPVTQERYTYSISELWSSGNVMEGVELAVYRDLQLISLLTFPGTRERAMGAAWRYIESLWS